MAEAAGADLRRDGFPPELVTTYVGLPLPYDARKPGVADGSAPVERDELRREPAVLVLGSVDAELLDRAATSVRTGLAEALTEGKEEE